MQLMIYLYLKTHNQTGYKYLGKHESSDPQSVYSYSGSGLDWVPHLKKHGNDVTTEVLFSSKCKDEFRSVAIGYSKKFDIVNSKDFANRIIEEGQGGGTIAGKIIINDGVTTRYIYPDEPIPEGWDKGSLKAGKIAINNGTTERYINPSEPIPEGWIKGGLDKDPEVVAKRTQTRTLSYYHIDDPDTIYFGQAAMAEAYGVSACTISFWIKTGKVVKFKK
jgi:hypothetical protein